MSAEELLDAAREGDTAAFEAFFAEPDATARFAEIKDEYSLAGPLHNAAANGHVDLLRFILGKLDAARLSELVNAQNDAGNTPLHWAALLGSLEAAQVLVEAGADGLRKNKMGMDPIYQAEAAEHEEIVDYLLGKFDVTPEDGDDEVVASAGPANGDGDASSGANASEASAEMDETA